MSRAQRWVDERLAPLESHDIVTAAMRAARASELGDFEFAPRLEVLCESLQHEAGLHLGGRRSARRWLIDAIADRIIRERAAASDGDAPGEHSTPQGPPGPIIVTGLSATLDRALATAIATTLAPGPLGTDGTGALGDDEVLMRMDVASMAAETEWHVPAFAELFDTADLTVAYRQLLDGGQHALPARWSVQHMERLSTIYAVRPKAIVVVIDTDIDAAVRRLSDDVARTRARHAREVDRAAVGRYWEWRCERMVARCEEQLATPAATSAIRITADAIVADPASVLGQIGDVSNQPVLRSPAPEVLDELRRLSAGVL